MKKKAQQGSFLMKMIIVAALILIGLFLIYKFIIQPTGGIDKTKMEAKCLDFYREVGEQDIFKANTCSSDTDCPENKDYCCDMIPADDYEQGDEKFLGCCISSASEIKDKCPGVIS